VEKSHFPWKQGGRLAISGSATCQAHAKKPRTCQPVRAAIFTGKHCGGPRDSRVSSKRLEALFQETQGSLPRDSRVSSKRLGGLFQETRGSLPRDSGVSSKRLRGLFKETRGSLPRDSRVSSKRLGGLFQETRGSLPRDSGVSSKRLEGLFKETRGSLPRDSGVSCKKGPSSSKRSGALGKRFEHLRGREDVASNARCVSSRFHRPPKAVAVPPHAKVLRTKRAPHFFTPSERRRAVEGPPCACRVQIPPPFPGCQGGGPSTVLRDCGFASVASAASNEPPSA